jgi:hypothetical protein
MAWTAQDSWNSRQVSCAHGTYTLLDDNMIQTSTQPITVGQIGTAPDVSGEYHLQSMYDMTNSSAKTTGDGATATWPGVQADRYRLWHTAHVSVNCNGVLPGWGNALLTGWVRYN